MRFGLRLKALTLSLSAAAFLAALAGESRAAPPWLDPNYEPTWDRIKRKGVLSTGCILQVPYWSKDRNTGEWKGWGITAAKQMAKDLDTKWECGETLWGTAALMIQSGKIDLLWAMQATPLRATAITFAGPLYNHGFMAVNHKNFKAKNWDDYNKPEVRIAIQSGTATAYVAKMMAPKAQHVELQLASQQPLAVLAGRADTLVVTVMNGVVAKARNPDLGDFVIPQPLISLPAYVGVANEIDRRFADFTHWWAEWYRLDGSVERWIKESFKEMGVPDEDIPDKLYF